MHDDISGDIGTRMLFENDRIRVWEVRLEPGESVHRHEHKHDYVQVMIEGDKIAANIDPQSVGRWAGEAYVEADVEVGKTIWAEAGSVHDTINTGGQTFYEILVELKP
jgi:beta-alanine degradation protein BauB